ncbi:hypothetical protein JCM5296_004448 [Sporobolomyces johnsonii]
MKSFTLLAFLFALVASAFALRVERHPRRWIDNKPVKPVKPAFTGTLYHPKEGHKVKLGGSFFFSYLAETVEMIPVIEALQSLDVGIQGPAPIIINPTGFQPFGILEVEKGLEPGIGNWINTTIQLPDEIYTAGTYFLIVTEHQLPVRDPDGLTYRVQSYNISLCVDDVDEW